MSGAVPAIVPGAARRPHLDQDYSLASNRGGSPPEVGQAWTRTPDKTAAGGRLTVDHLVMGREGLRNRHTLLAVNRSIATITTFCDQPVLGFLRCLLPSLGGKFVQSLWRGVRV